MYVARQSEKVVTAENLSVPIPRSEEWPVSLDSIIEVPNVLGRKAVHEAIEIWISQLNQQVVVVTHKAERVQFDLVGTGCTVHEGNELSSILRSSKNV